MLLGSTHAHADIFRLRDPLEQRVGEVIRRDTRSITVRYYDTKQTTAEFTFEAARVVGERASFSAARLTSLAPSNPLAYLEYAEELAPQWRDPIARRLAIRLYALAAQLDQAKLAPRAVRGLIDLARSPSEEHQWHRALFLVDPRLSEATLLSLGPSPSAPQRLALEQALAAVRLARQGLGDQARTSAANPAVAAILRNYELLLTRNEFDLATKTVRLSDRQLQQLLTCELLLEQRLDPQFAPASDTPLGDLLAAGANAPVRWPNPARLTEFDPRETLYREGKWMPQESAAPQRK
jgi:hypothetical protein